MKESRSTLTQLTFYLVLLYQQGLINKIRLCVLSRPVPVELQASISVPDVKVTLLLCLFMDILCVFPDILWTFHGHSFGRSQVRNTC